MLTLDEANELRALALTALKAMDSDAGLRESMAATTALNEWIREHTNFTAEEATG